MAMTDQVSADIILQVQQKVYEQLRDFKSEFLRRYELQELEISKAFNTLLEPDIGAGSPTPAEQGCYLATRSEALVPPPPNLSRLEHIGKELERLRHVMGRELALLSRDVVRERASRATTTGVQSPKTSYSTSYSSPDYRYSSRATSVAGSPSELLDFNSMTDGRSSGTGASSPVDNKPSSRNRGLSAKEASCQSPLEHLGLVQW